MKNHYSEDFGNGKLYRATQVISWFFINTILFILCQSLLFAFFLFVEPSLKNIVWYLLGLIPVGPILVSLIASAIYSIEYSDYSEPFKRLFKYFKSNFIEGLVIWLTFLLLVYLFSVNINYYFNISDVLGRSFGWLFVVFIFALCLLMIPLLMITVKFKFKLKDKLKISVLYMFSKPVLTIGNFFILGIIGFIILRISEWFVFFFPVILIYLVILYNYRLITWVNDNFIDHKEEIVNE